MRWRLTASAANAAAGGGGVRSTLTTSVPTPNDVPAVAVATIVCDGGDSTSVTVRHQVVPMTTAGTGAAPSITSCTAAPRWLTVPHSGNVLVLPATVPSARLITPSAAGGEKL